VCALVLGAASCGGGGNKHAASKKPPTSALMSPAGLIGVKDKMLGPKDPLPKGAAGGIRAEPLPGHYKEPTWVGGVPGAPGTVAILERAGVAHLVRDGRELPGAFFDVSDEVSTEGGEQGAQSIAFAPDYARSGLLYVFFTDRGDDLRIVELHRSTQSPDRVDAGSERVVILIHHPTNFIPGEVKGEDLRVHNGGQLAFGPDKMLYIGTGDGGGQKDPARRGQDLRQLLGKILRIDPRPSHGRGYTIPRDNPFATTRNARPEIWAYGLRNPYRFSFDPKSRDLIIGDVGQNAVEEVDVMPAGSKGGVNFGWSCFEGTRRFRQCGAIDYVKPVIQLASSATARRCAAITGGLVVHNPQLPALDGRYIYSDFCTGVLRSARIVDGRAEDNRPVGMTLPWPSDFGVDSSGNLYVTSYWLGRICRIVAA
jgi:glucose/arabinose dehydrogenase